MAFADDEGLAVEVPVPEPPFARRLLEVMGEVGARALVDDHRVEGPDVVVVGVPVRLADVVPEPEVEVHEPRAIEELVAGHVDAAVGVRQERRVVGVDPLRVVGVLVGPEVDREHHVLVRVVAVQ